MSSLFGSVPSRSFSLLLTVSVISKSKATPNHEIKLFSDLENLEVAILKLSQMLQRVINYVDSVLVNIPHCVPLLLTPRSHSISFAGEEDDG